MQLSKRNKVTRSMVNKELTRIRSIVRDAEKEGYIFHNVIPKNVNVTKSTLSRLRSITREDLLKTARKVDLVTGEVLDTQAERNIKAKIKQKEIKNKIRQRKHYIKTVRKKRYASYYTGTQQVNKTNYYPKFSDIVIDRFKEKFARMPAELSGKINGLIEQLINEQGVEDVAIALENLADKLVASLVAQGFTTDYIVEMIGQAVIQNLPNASDQYKYDIAEAYEANETGYIIPD